MKHGLTMIVLLIAQVIVWSYFNLSQYVLLTFLPAMVLCLPVRMGTVKTLLIAAAASLAIDFLTHGILGLTCAAVLPVAFCRRFVISLVFGEELIEREEDLSFRRQGFFKMNLAVIICTALFLLVYIWLDGAGMRSLAFNGIRFACSLVASSLVSLFIATMLTDEENHK